MVSIVKVPTLKTELILYSNYIKSYIFIQL